MRKYLPYILVLLLVLLAGAGYWYMNIRPTSAPVESFQAYGVIEAGQVHVSPEIGSRISEISVEEGDLVRAGQTLVVLDRSLVNAQREQAAADLKAAQAAVKAAASELALIQAGPLDEALAVAQAGIDKAKAELDATKDAYTNLSDRLKDQAEGKALKAQQAQAEAAVRAAQAEYNLVQAGTRQPQIDAAQAQVDAATARASSAQAALDAIEIQRGKYILNAPAAGVILERAAEPGEYAAVGSTLLVIGRLDRLSLTISVPEDQLGEIQLDQADPDHPYQVSVDAFPDEIFQARVTRISPAANSPAAGSPEGSAFLIRLTLDDAGGKLKPGILASVLIK